jgi:hypothetical protein
MRPNCTQTQRQECNAIAAMLNDVATESYEELRAIRRTVLGQQRRMTIYIGRIDRIRCTMESSDAQSREFIAMTGGFEPTNLWDDTRLIRFQT